MKLYPRRGFEWAADRCVGLWCPILTGETGLQIYDSNLTTNNHAGGIGYSNQAQPWVGSEFGRVFRFDGTDDRVTNSINQIYTLGTNDFAFGGWFFINATTGVYGPLISTWGNSSNAFAGRWFLGMFDARLRFFDSLGNIAISYVLPTTGTWNHYVVSKRSGVVTLYVNAIEVGTYTGGNQNWNVDGAVSIGGTSNGFVNTNFAEAFVRFGGYTQSNLETLYAIGPGGAYQREPVRPRSYFAELLTTPNRRRSSRFLAFPG